MEKLTKKMFFKKVIVFLAFLTLAFGNNETKENYALISVVKSLKKVLNKQHENG